MVLIESTGKDARRACTIVLNVEREVDYTQVGVVLEYMYSGDFHYVGVNRFGLHETGFSSTYWGNYAQEMNTFSDHIKGIEKNRSKIDKNIELINDPDKKKYNNEIEGIRNFYNSFISLYNLAKSPSGNIIVDSSEFMLSDSNFSINKSKVEKLLE